MENYNNGWRWWHWVILIVVIVVAVGLLYTWLGNMNNNQNQSYINGTEQTIKHPIQSTENAINDVVE